MPRDQAAAALAALAGAGRTGAVTLDEGVGKVSVVGAALRERTGAADAAARLLREAGIEVRLTAAGPERISCVVPEALVDDAVRLWHRTMLAPSPQEA